MELKQYTYQKRLVKQTLLIVPYGIETTLVDSYYNWKELLIVPYGIETWNNSRAGTLAEPFNRTLWN